MKKLSCGNLLYSHDAPVQERENSSINNVAPPEGAGNSSINTTISFIACSDNPTENSSYK